MQDCAVVAIPRRRIGLVAGLSWVSSAEYYRLIHELCANHSSGGFTPSLVLDSLDEQQFLRSQQSDPSEVQCLSMVLDSAWRLKQMGCEEIAFCANGIHRFASVVEESLDIRLVHIVRAVMERLMVDQVKRVGLLGVMKTMEGDFYRKPLGAAGIAVVAPDSVLRQRLHAAIVDEMCKGRFTDDARAVVRECCLQLQSQGAEAVVLACTELPLLLRGREEFCTAGLMSYDSLLIHCQALVEQVVNPPQIGAAHRCSLDSPPPYLHVR